MTVAKASLQLEYDCKGERELVLPKIVTARLGCGQTEVAGYEADSSWLAVVITIKSLHLPSHWLLKSPVFRVYFHDPGF